MKPPALTPRPCLRTLVPYQPGKPIAEVQREFGLTDVVKLASNENPLGPSPRALVAAKKSLDAAGLYPDGACFELRRALARKFAWDPEHLILGCGSNELLLLLGQAFLNPGDEVLTADMTFVVYPTVAHLSEAKLVAVPMKKFAFNLAAMARAITPATKIIFIANPNNPTGTALPPRELERFAAKVPAGCLLVLDEAYFEYLDPA
ncbi:MAG: aminotransferase class I/II-fold pyridoxal phosphate-dependent enzyme, partial [Candidatus Firestonebacteria bacterium]|nr:aminotransferase class I/II-fold pyridoxal phosphate-dependent enzyme [Candidatus Firestonebacteria bacterium]